MNRISRLRLGAALGVLLLGVPLFGCSSAGGSSTTPTDPSGPTDPTDPTDPTGPTGPVTPEWADQPAVDAILTSSCGSCHGSSWSSCWDDQSYASSLENVIANGFMPPGNPLPAAEKATVLDWLDAGAPCSGQKPDEGDAAPPPIIGVAG